MVNRKRFRRAFISSAMSKLIVQNLRIGPG
jgi:hypothetical protein